jgi:hypothetical protein
MSSTLTRAEDRITVPRILPASHWPAFGDDNNWSCHGPTSPLWRPLGPLPSRAKFIAIVFTVLMLGLAAMLYRIARPAPFRNKINNRMTAASVVDQFNSYFSCLTRAFWD